MGREIRIKRNDLEKFCTDVFFKLGLSEAEAADSAEILVAADARGIASHGVGRLWRYENGLKKGIMAGGVQPETLRETPISLVLDARGAMGLSLSKVTMGQGDR
jgi:Malate/L-lactate dehydrogenases